MSEHFWKYAFETAGGTTEYVVPLSEGSLLLLVKGGKLARITLVQSPTRTQDAWKQLQAVPGLLKLREFGEQERKAMAERRQVPERLTDRIDGE